MKKEKQLRKVQERKKKKIINYKGLYLFVRLDYTNQRGNRKSRIENQKKKFITDYDSSIK